MLKFKTQNRSKIQILKQKFNHLDFVIWIYFVIWILSFGFINSAYALNIDKVKVNLLKGDYKSAISEGEKLIEKYAHSSHADELYYILGLSYLKDDNFLRASDIFEIILEEFKDSKFKEEAKLGLGDTYFLRGDFTKAEQHYQELIKSNPNTKLKAQAYYRLSQAGFKKGDTKQAKEYLAKLKQEFPLNPESIVNKELSSITDFSSDLYYTVQVGAFSNIANANNLKEKLIKKGYPAYIEEANLQGKVSYRVRIAKFHSRWEAQNLEEKLSREGYPTRIYP